MPDSDVTVIIPSYNQKDHIGKCLESVLSQKTEFSYDVIVVDSSRDGTADLVERKYPSVHVIRLPKRAYPGTARNAGIKHAKGEVIAFTDCDCVVSENWIQKIMENQRNGKDAVGGAVGNGTPGNIIGTTEFLLEFNDFLGTRGIRRVKVLPTCNLSYKRELFEKYGGFENTVKGSDSIFSRKMDRQGVGVYLDPEIIMYHTNRTSPRKFFRNQYNLGMGSAFTRRRINIQASFLVRMPVLVPLIPFLRTAAITTRLLRWSPGNFVKFVLLYPLVFLGLLVFTAGFIHGIHTSRSL